MLAGLRLGPGPRVRKLQLESFPDLTVVQEHLFELSLAPAGARLDFLWSVGPKSYVLTVGHSQRGSQADWKLYRCSGQQSNFLWEHRTNDVTLIYNLVLSETGESNRIVSGHGRLSTIHGKLIAPEANTGHYVTCTQNQANSGPGVSLQPVIDSFDLSQARQLTQRLCVQDWEVYSYPVFLLMFDQEYCRAVDHGSRFTIVLFELGSVQKPGGTTLPDQSTIYDCLKQLKRLHRKTDVLAKYTADRFAILLPETDTRGGKLFAQKIERALLRNALINGGGGFVKVKFGIAGLQDRWTSAESILLAAEHALSKAEITEETVVVFDPASDPPTENKRIELDWSIRSLMQVATVQGGVYSYPAFLLLLEREYHRATRHNENLFFLQFKLKANQSISAGRAETASSVAHAQFLERLLAFKQDGDTLALSPDQTLNVMRRGASSGCLRNLASSLVRRLGTDHSLSSDFGLGKFQILSRICEVARNQSSSDCLNLVAVD